ncbi:DapH/DapD/GlmU-related protein [Mangrovihabitans endophyticus]|uniref:UDP-3-O-(3-hydroxymyristoyl)glucosamine N-acyltransferase n=1 Tax=Mangrovihabitans endophyticus TaxID=1751298 RepID=A0A8J3BXQ4_9ACTN|nr:DapH/DapD/GlmU-related protein [Mangrovihabitans endophyticus]GGK79101.1 UDP-3-O-(3-hydroxymyristoyl)glucosamine N-acyltransferase [Mangrovihabitans endophyticus]
MTHPMTPDELITAAELVQSGLLQVGADCRVHPTAVFLPADLRGTVRPIVFGEHVTVGAYAVLHGGLTIGDHAHVGHHTVLGEPEYGYAVRERHPGTGGSTVLGTGVIIRAGAIVYAGTTIGDQTTIGHHTLLRTGVSVGAGSQLAANLTVERGTSIGSGVRCSPGSHLTADTVVGDRAFLGAGVRTVNDKHLIWRQPGQELPLNPPIFLEGCKVGSGAVVLAGVTVGPGALVGAGAVVTRDVADNTVVYGVPSARHGQVTR